MPTRLYRVKWESTDAPMITRPMIEFLYTWQTDSGTFSFDLDDLNTQIEEEGGVDPEVQPLVDWLRKYITSDETYDFDIG